MSIVESSVEKSEMIEAAFEFWFKDNQHIRSPFPEYIRQKLKQNAVAKFSRWVNNLKSEAKDEMNEEMIAEKFEQILFEEAVKLVMTEDEKITLHYPFLPRIGDRVFDENNEVGLIQSRYIQQEKDHGYLKVKLEKESKIWETSFELPV